MNFDEIKELPSKTNIYDVVRPLHTAGRHGISYEAKRRSDGERVFVKMPRLDFTEHQDQDVIRKRLDHLTEKFKAEAKNGSHLTDVANIAHALDSGTVTHVAKFGNVEIPFLVQRFVSGEDIRTFVQDIYGGARGEFTGIQDDNVWLQLAQGIIQPLQAVHEKGIVHGDLHPGNVLISNPGSIPVIIDFGESFIRDLKSHKRDPGYGAEYAAPEKTGKSRTPTPEPWEAPSDIYSFGILMYFLATGKTPKKTPSRDSANQLADLHDYLLERITNSNPKLITSNPCVLHVILLALRPNPHERATARQLLDYIRLIRDSGATHLGISYADLIQKELSSLSSDAALLSARPPEPLIGELLRMNVERFGEKVRQLIHYGRFEMSGDRTEMLNYLQRFMASMGPNDTYMSVTHPVFWSPSNLGVKGRFFDQNILLGKRNIKVRRLFVVSKEEDDEDLELRNRVFRAHRELAIKLDACDIEVRPNSLDPRGFYTGVVEKNTNPEVNEILESGYLVGVAIINSKPYSLTFRGEGKRKIIRRIAIQRIQGEELARASKKFEQLQKAAFNIMDWKDPDLGLR